MSPSEGPVKVAVLMGGICGERDVSLSTGSCVAKNLLLAGHAVVPVCIHPDGNWERGPSLLDGATTEGPESWFSGRTSPALSCSSQLIEEGAGCFFNALHGPGGEDGTIQGFLRFLGLPFTGPDVTPAALTMDKALTKSVLRDAGIRTPGGFEIPAMSGESPNRFLEILANDQSVSVPFPWVVKPNCLGSSVGIMLIHSPEEFISEGLVNTATWCPSPGLSGSGFIVEEKIEGRELTCGILEPELGKALALPPVEILPKSSEFFDYKAKYTLGEAEEICPARISDELTAEVQSLAARVHEVFSCDPLSRTDIFLTDDEELVVLEINTLPGMTETSLIPQSAQEAGINLPELFDQLVRHAIAREAMREAVDSL